MRRAKTAIGGMSEKDIDCDAGIYPGSLSVQTWAGERGNRQDRQMDPDRRARMQEKLA